jgi:hypothetical protein
MFSFFSLASYSKLTVPHLAALNGITWYQSSHNILKPAEVNGITRSTSKLEQFPDSDKIKLTNWYTSDCKLKEKIEMLPIFDDAVWFFLQVCLKQ